MDPLGNHLSVSLLGYLAPKAAGRHSHVSALPTPTPISKESRSPRGILHS